MNNAHVDVDTQYLAEQSKPESDQYVYAYTIRISNRGDNPMQLISRHWIITDANDETQELQGIGVVGDQPTIAPGECYTYTSGVVMKTKTGMMSGKYSMIDAFGQQFQANIPPFALVQKQALH